MIRSFLFLVLLLGIQSLSFAQGASWSRDDRSSIYLECTSLLGQYPQLTVEQKESIGLCYLDELTKKYSKADYQAKIDIEVRRIRESTLLQCVKHLGISIDAPAPVEEKPVPQYGEVTPSKENLMGHWKNDESEFWLIGNGDYRMDYFSGKRETGTWRISDNNLDFYKKRLIGVAEKRFRILLQTNRKFVYQSQDDLSKTLIANRLEQ